MIVPWGDARRGGTFDERWQQDHLCGVCGGRIVEATVPDQPEMCWVGCAHRSHAGFERVRGWWERWKAGGAVPIEIAEGLRKREAKEIERWLESV